MQQPELGKRLTALRKEKNLTQEELVERSHVSVRTIQRIEAGEVLPRISTIKILLQALGENPDTFFNQKIIMETQSKPVPTYTRTALLAAVFAGGIYLAVETILNAMGLAWLTKENDWAQWVNFIYIGLTVTMVVAYVFFMTGFIVLSSIFENGLLRTGSYMMIGAVVAISILDVSTLWMNNDERLWIPYITASVVIGALTLIFGIALIRLQDGMGELSRAAGVLEIITGAAFLSVLLFFIGYVVMIPAVIVEILVLYRGYEYVAKLETSPALPS
ncbi:MAG: helix-turn-helix transcriptional regulator [Cyclobacteriaceae bacterium]|nr:helix-turn-helix transcriptional regulator [Cyclobacteriaceae bacterium]